MLSAAPESPSRSLREQGEAAREELQRRAGGEATHLAYAPGRVNLIGEYTDLNGGFVLPLAIERGIFVAARPRTDRRVRLWSTQMPEDAVELDLDTPLRPEGHSWSNYVRGVLAGLIEAGVRLPGFDAVVHATLPAGGGLSSSAALEAAFATLGESLSGHTLEPVEKARLCQKAEHQFAGTPCGIMDQFAVILGQRGQLLLIDCHALEHELVPMRSEDVSLLVINTMVKHELTDGGYARLRDECFEAARVLGVPELCQATPATVEGARARLSEGLYLRARHVTTENARTLAAVAALRREDWRELGALMYASHESLRDDFQVSCAELDLVVNAARALGEAGGVYGCRLTGGGFGGCCVALVKTPQADAIREALRASYQAATGLEPPIFPTRPADGCAVLLAP